MSLTLFQKIALGIAGITALAIGGFILIAPTAFYASYHIVLPADASFMSELRAPAAGLTALGAIMLGGLVRAAWSSLALAAALIVYLGFPVGRLVSIVFDGMPSASILGVLAIEVAIALLCLVAFRNRLTVSRSPASGFSAAN